MISPQRRIMSRVSLVPEAGGTWSVRIVYFDDDTEDRQGGFTCRASAHGWAEARLQRHFNLGVPGRLGAGA